MIFNENKIFGKVWKVKKSDNNKYIDLQMSTSEKTQEGEYINSNWFPRCIGKSVNQLKELQEGDRITITKSKLTNVRYQTEDGEWRSGFKFLILEATIDGAELETEKAKYVEEKPTKGTATESSSCPW